MINRQNIISQRGGIGLNIITAILAVVIGVLIFTLMRDAPTRTNKTIGIDSPATSTTTRHPITPQERLDMEFDDGLGESDSSTTYPLDEWGAGLFQVDVFIRDINNDGRPDKITRSQIETGTAHFSYEYRIEINTPDGMIDITPENFKTVEGADCSLQKLRFVFSPSFGIVKISRPWQETWTTPTMATRDIYSIVNDDIHHLSSNEMGVVCDVMELF